VTSPAGNDTKPTSRHDRGASLVVAVGFVVFIGAITAGLSAMVTSQLTGRIALSQVRDEQYAADAAVEQAIASLRGSIRTTAAACGGITSGTSTGTSRSTTNGRAIRVDWTMACGVIRTTDGVAVAQHNAVFTSCPDSSNACTDAVSIVRAQVNFQVGSTGAVTATFVQSWSTT
jgi:hypothetical protein